MGVTISVAYGFIENQAAPLEGQLTSDTCLLHLSFCPLSSLWLFLLLFPALLLFTTASDHT